MKSWLIKLLASEALKLGVAYAHRAIVLATDAINGVISSGNINEDLQQRLIQVARALVAVGKLVARLAAYIGAPNVALSSATEKLDEATDKLLRILPNV